MPFRIVFLIVLVLVSRPLHPQTPVGEYELKAALLYNFTRFIDWPGEKSGEFHLCMAGRDPFGPELDALASRSVRERPIRVERQSSHLRNCDMVFVAAGTSPPASSAGVLVVGEDAAALSQGAVIALRLEGTRIVFDINQDAAVRADLKISYKLLRLARSVR